jgi:hypothetical protein
MQTTQRAVRTSEPVPPVTAHTAIRRPWRKQHANLGQFRGL